MAFDCLDRKLSKEPKLTLDDMNLYLAHFSRSRRRLFSDPDHELNIKDLLYGADALNCGTDIRHFEKFCTERSDNPLVEKVNEFCVNKLFEKDQKEFHYDFIFHLVEDYEEMPTKAGESVIPRVIGCSFHPRGLFIATKPG
jgi:hypothetical protein